MNILCTFPIFMYGYDTLRHLFPTILLDDFLIFFFFFHLDIPFLLVKSLMKVETLDSDNSPHPHPIYFAITQIFPKMALESQPIKPAANTLKYISISLIFLIFL